MFDSLWRPLRKNAVGSSGGKKLSKERYLSSRPQLEALEDRVMPTVLPGMVPPVAPPPPPPGGTTASGSFSNLQPITNPPTGSTNQMSVTVIENSPQTIINMDLIFAELGGLQYEDGLQLSMLGNTNTGLVTPDLSEAELTLNYAPGKAGTATVTVGATDADGVSEQESILVTVIPLNALGMGTPPLAPTTPTMPTSAMVSPITFPSA